MSGERECEGKGPSLAGEKARGHGLGRGVVMNEAPMQTPTPPPVEEGQRVVGVVEVTLHGIGTSQMTATARLVRAAPGPSLALVPAGGGAGDGTLRLESEFVGSFTHGVRGAGGTLYMHAGFRVLNMTEGGTPYDTPRRNLTFLGAATVATIDTTPVREIKRFDGSSANPALASQLRPTGMVNRSADGVLYADGPDVLQVYMEHEVRAVTPDDVKAAARRWLDPDRRAVVVLAQLVEQVLLL